MDKNEALKRIAEKLRRSGANIPAPQVTGTIEGCIVTGLCIALALVESEIEALEQPAPAQPAQPAPAQPAPVPLTWQSMESAPKDGAEILLYSLGDVGVCYWRDDEVMTGWTWGAGKSFGLPTHWMPIPDAPAIEAAQPASDKHLQLALEALAPLEKLFTQADAKGLLSDVNVDCQIATSELRKSVYAAIDIRAYLNTAAPTEQNLVAWNLADKVRQDLDRQSCPDAFMRIAVESIVKHHPPAQPAQRTEQESVIGIDVAKNAYHQADVMLKRSNMKRFVLFGDIEFVGGTATIHRVKSAEFLEGADIEARAIELDNCDWVTPHYSDWGVVFMQYHEEK